jgi:hypothetical protein
VKTPRTEANKGLVWQILSRSPLVLLSLILSSTLVACGGGGDSGTVTIRPTTQPSPPPPSTAPPTVTLTLPPTVAIGETITLPAGAISATIPAGLPATGAFRLQAALGGITVFDQTIDAATAGCSAGATSCNSASFPLTIGQDALPGVYTLTVTVFDQGGRSASDSTTVTLT